MYFVVCNNYHTRDQKHIKRASWKHKISRFLLSLLTHVHKCKGAVGDSLTSNYPTNTIIINILTEQTPNFRRHNIKTCTTHHENLLQFLLILLAMYSVCNISWLQHLNWQLNKGSHTPIWCLAWL
jgi:hypothetical protein